MGKILWAQNEREKKSLHALIIKYTNVIAILCVYN